MKKASRDVINLHMPTHAIYTIFMLLEIWSVTEIIFFILGYLLPFYPPNSLKIKILKKWKKHLEIYLQKHHFILVYYKWQSCDLWPLRYRWSATNRIFSHFGPFLDQLKILKNEKKHQDIIILHKCIIYDNHLRYMVPEIWSTTDRFFVILGHLPHEKLKNSKSWKTKTSTCSVIFYTCVPKIMILCLFPIKLAILSFHTCVP